MFVLHDGTDVGCFVGLDTGDDDGIGVGIVVGLDVGDNVGFDVVADDVVEVGTGVETSEGAGVWLACEVSPPPQKQHKSFIS